MAVLGHHTYSNLYFLFLFHVPITRFPFLFPIPISIFIFRCSFYSPFSFLVINIPNPRSYFLFSIYHSPFLFSVLISIPRSHFPFPFHVNIPRSHSPFLFFVPIPRFSFLCFNGCLLTCSLRILVGYSRSLLHEHWKKICQSIGCKCSPYYGFAEFNCMDFSRIHELAR